MKKWPKLYFPYCKKFDRKDKSTYPKDFGENKKQHDESLHESTSTEVQVTLKDSSIIIPKTENNENLEEVTILKTEKDPLDIEETILETGNSTNIEANLNEDEERCLTCEMILPKKLMEAHINIEHTLGLYEKIQCKI